MSIRIVRQTDPRPVSGALAGPGMPAWVATVFGSSPVVVASIMAIILNLALPREQE
jgi:NCS2 family nucleobase:cation symporter-2